MKILEKPKFRQQRMEIQQRKKTVSRELFTQNERGSPEAFTYSRAFGDGYSAICSGFPTLHNDINLQTKWHFDKFVFLLFYAKEIFLNWKKNKILTALANMDRQEYYTINHISTYCKDVYIKETLFCTFCSPSFFSIDHGARLSWLPSGSSTNIDIVSSYMLCMISIWKSRSGTRTPALFDYNDADVQPIEFKWIILWLSIRNKIMYEKLSDTFASNIKRERLCPCVCVWFPCFYFVFIRWVGGGDSIASRPL